MSKHYHHGRTPAAWAGSILAAIAFTLGSIGFVLGPNWPLIGGSAGLLVVAVVVGGVLRKMGYGQA